MTTTKIISLLFSLLFSFTSFFSFLPRSVWYGEETYTVDDSESIVFHAALTADVHSQSAFFDERSKAIRKIICGVSQTDSLPDVLVIAGDISNATDEKEYRMLKWSLSAFNQIPRILPAAGNHDVRAGASYEDARSKFCRFACFCGIETDKVYYSTSVKGYPFIVLGSESPLSIEAELSDEQLAWFEAQLVQALKTEKPVFIISHQAMYHSHGLTYKPEAEKNWGLGKQSEKVEAILRKYVPAYPYPVFFISGHLHYAFNENTVDDTFCRNLHCISLPSVSKTNSGGLGMSLEVYPDRLLLKERNFLTMEDYASYEYAVKQVE